MKKVLVFDGRSRAALSIIRSLGGKGIYIIVGEAFNCSSFYSKYCKEKIIYPAADKDPEGFKKFILEYLEKNKIDLIIPVRDHVTEILINYKQLFIKYTKFVSPALSSFNTARDKAETIKLCRLLGIPHPRTVISKEEGYSLEKLKAQFELPVLIKPRISSGSRGISVVKDWDQFHEVYNNVNNEFPNPMIQEFIPHGGAFGVSMLYKEGKCKASFTHKRIREYPVSGGPSTLREGVHYEEIEKYSSSLLNELKWNGVAMVEYRVDKNTGVPKLMEINPRFWGSLETAVFSGIDFPNLLYEIAMKGDCEDSFTYQVGKQVRWLFFGDIMWFLSSKKNWKNIKAFFKFQGKNLSYDIFSWRDLGPTFGAFIEAFNSLSKSERRKHAFKRGWE